MGKLETVAESGKVFCSSMLSGCSRLEVRCPEEMEQASTEELTKLTYQGSQVRATR